MADLEVAVDAWIIQDGNYADFAVGDLATFALEFSGKALRPANLAGSNFRRIDHGVYEVTAEVLFADAKAWVVDFGFRAYWESAPPAFALPGSRVTGTIIVGIDPFFYKEYLHKTPGMPQLTYDWRILSIVRNDTPWLAEVHERGGKTLSRDVTRESWSRVSQTDAWNDDDGRSSYVLAVERRDV